MTVRIFALAGAMLAGAALQADAQSGGSGGTGSDRKPSETSGKGKPGSDPAASSNSMGGVSKPPGPSGSGPNSNMNSSGSGNSPDGAGSTRR